MPARAVWLGVAGTRGRDKRMYLIINNVFNLSRVGPLLFLPSHDAQAPESSIRGPKNRVPEQSLILLMSLPVHEQISRFVKKRVGFFLLS